MRGRKPKPTAQRHLEGNPGRRAFNLVEPAPPPAAATDDAPPAVLTGHPHALAEWIRLAPMLRQARVITQADLSALTALCLEWDRYLVAMAEVQRLGMVVKAPSGYPIPNPYLPIATRALAACTKLWPELGLTPSSRTRVKTIEGGTGGDDFSEFDAPPIQLTN